MSSSTRSNALPSSSTLSSFPLENTEVHTIDDEKYVLLLTFCQRSLENLESDLEDEDEDTMSIHRDKHTAMVQLPPPSHNFDYFIHPRPLHYTFINLYNSCKYELYSLSKNAGDVGRPWQDINRKELIIWITLIIYQGLFNSSSLNQYWNENTKLPIHNISKQMSLFRFEQIKRYLHISSPTATINNYFKKLEPLLSKIRDVSKQLYTPSLNISVNEMMVRFSRRSVHTVRIKNKSTPEGFKILSLCESGYTYTFLPISRISPSGVPKVNSLNQVGCLVHHLITQLPYHRSSFNVYMNNYFSNVPLFQNLRQLGIGACETVCKTASGFPKELRIEKNVKLDWDIRSGVIVNGVLSVFWQDNGPITMLSTIHGLVGEEWEIERERQ
ncbi:11392_t:CDS:2 [Acaulospora morrowiae]|uniref:11392_t:CDS:1 n=1 Tax=Acaulospora morrowiae TaxID=94023 RepID=A0A9N9HPT9_9GLOM|nr:11392_t:CDS:2 [Acaulospora morrowiae]